ncbi:hypothetical protein MJG53_008030 [Ovis ammon polii x Ovis aries]|uniref:Uncharacterized protein n=1 Tax=Ovis ammon polii x Ovis aries TaxID=2918886 RepID=A0ACB9UZD5_9CETA|nr:hypothetical protein MJG53_008030 [Ovis ammon polii x Ovis aries]
MCAASVLHSLPCIPSPEDLEAILDFFSFTDHPVGAASPLPCQTRLVGTDDSVGLTGANQALTLAFSEQTLTGVILPTCLMQKVQTVHKSTANSWIAPVSKPAHGELYENESFRTPREPEILLPTVFRAVKQFSSDFHKERKNVLIFIKSKVIDILVNLALKEVSRCLVSLSLLLSQATFPIQLTVHSVHFSPTIHGVTVGWKDTDHWCDDQLRSRTPRHCSRLSHGH